jgi:hypothetical protein
MPERRPVAEKKIEVDYVCEFGLAYADWLQGGCVGGVPVVSGNSLQAARITTIAEGLVLHEIIKEHHARVHL